jgi:hypothetical protein
MYLVQFTTTCVSLVHNVRMFPIVLSQALYEVCLTCTLRYDVSRVLSQALDEVCLTCTLRYDASRVLSQALDEVCLTCTLR